MRFVENGDQLVCFCEGYYNVLLCFVYKEGNVFQVLNK